MFKFTTKLKDRPYYYCSEQKTERNKEKETRTRMWANAQRDGRPAEHRWRPLFNASNFG